MGLYRLNYKNVISFSNEELGITLCEQTFLLFFLPNQLKFFHVASDSTEKHCPAFFFLPVLAYFARKNVCKIKIKIKIGNKRNVLSSLFSKISRAGDYSYLQHLPT